jgi:hypothetical protein
MSDAESFFDADEPSGGEHPYIKNGRYWLPNDQGEVVGYTRATTLAETLDNQYALNSWKLRQAVRGMGLHPSLGARAASIGTDDPRYKETLWAVVKEALSAAGTDSGSDNGTALHKVLERADRGEDLSDLPDFFNADIMAYRDAIAQHNITILPEYIERTVKCEYYDTVGTLDRVAKLEDGTYAIFDIKTETDPVRYPHAKSIQFAIYAAARVAINSATNQYETMPQVRTDFALIAWIRPGSGKCEILQIPIDVGLWGLRLSVETRAWRNTKIPVTPYISNGSWKVPQTSVPRSETYPGVVIPPPEMPMVVLTDEAKEFVEWACGTDVEVYDPHTYSGGGVPYSPVSPPQEPLVLANPDQQPQWSGLNSVTIQAVVRPDGVPPGTVPMGPASAPPQWPAPATETAPMLPVPPERPPAPVSGSEYDPAAKAEELIAGPPMNARSDSGEGVDYKAWEEEQIAVMIVPKKEVIQEVCRTLGRRIEQDLHVPSGVTEPSLKKHKRPLAERALELAAKLRQTAVSEPPATAPEQVNGAVRPTEVDLNYLLASLSTAPTPEAHSALYHAWVGHFGEDAWNDPRIHIVSNNRMMELSKEGVR